MVYGWSERANLLWKVPEQMYGLSNSKKSPSSAPKNISSSSTLFDQSQEGWNLIKLAAELELLKLDNPV
jgi:hypothetical protein